MDQHVTYVVVTNNFYVPEISCFYVRAADVVYTNRSVRKLRQFRLPKTTFLGKMVGYGVEVNKQFSFFFLKILPPAVSFLSSASIVTSNAMNIIALINRLLSYNATLVDASAPEDHAGAERSIDGVEQGGVEFNLVADLDDERNEGSSDESSDSAAAM